MRPRLIFGYVSFVMPRSKKLLRFPDFTLALLRSEYTPRDTLSLPALPGRPQEIRADRDLYDAVRSNAREALASAL